MGASETRRLVVRGAPGPDAGPGVEEIVLPGVDGGIAPRAILDALVARGLTRILVEGGANTISRFIDAGCIDRLHVLVAPMIIGSGKTGLDLAPIDTLAGALRPKTTVTVLADGDVLFDCDLRSVA
jgi:riboflavin biosynthesis pyrimidine reductase